MRLVILSLIFLLGSIFSLNAAASENKKICTGFAKWTKDGEFKTIRSKCITEKEYLANKCTMGSLKRPNCNIDNKESKKKSSKK